MEGFHDAKVSDDAELIRLWPGDVRSIYIRNSLGTIPLTGLAFDHPSPGHPSDLSLEPLDQESFDPCLLALVSNPLTNGPRLPAMTRGGVASAAPSRHQRFVAACTLALKPNQLSNGRRNKVSRGDARSAAPSRHQLSEAD